MTPSMPFQRGFLATFLLTCCFFSLLVHGSQDQGFDHVLHKRENTTELKPLAAVVVLNGPSTVNGTLKFRQAYAENATHITGTIQGLDKNAQRGMHVHTFGDLTNGCASSALHWNPHNVSHGGAGDNEGHVGDLGNIQSDDQGVARIDIWSKKIQLFGPYTVIGRTVVVHNGTDDLGTKGDPGSLSVGNSGGRSACGIIGFADPTVPA